MTAHCAERGSLCPLFHLVAVDVRRLKAFPGTFLNHLVESFERGEVLDGADGRKTLDKVETVNEV